MKNNKLTPKKSRTKVGQKVGQVESRTMKKNINLYTMGVV